MKAAARRTAVVILSRSLHVYVSLTASVENLDMDNISRHGCGIWFLSGYIVGGACCHGLAEQQGPDQDAQLSHLEYSIVL